MAILGTTLLLLSYQSTVTSFQSFPLTGVDNILTGTFARPRRSRPLHMVPFDDQHSHFERDRRNVEFMNLGPVHESEVRRERLDRDEENQASFATYGNDLWDLRKKLEEISQKLIDAISNDNFEEEAKIRQELRETELRDPELVYQLDTAAQKEASREGRMQNAEMYEEQAMQARSCLPPYNLEGLWVGKYGEHGYQMINVTYVGDILIAIKVTGDRNVPRNEISFQVDLSPKDPNGLATTGVGGSEKKPTSPLDPIVLSGKAAKRWGTHQLPRYRGLGQVAKAGFVDNKWVDGQLIVIGSNYFSFAWVPLEHQIFFGRPSPELTLKMLREGGQDYLREVSNSFAEPPSIDENTEVLKQYISSCLDITTDTMDEEGLQTEILDSCIWHESSSEECYFE